MVFAHSPPVVVGDEMYIYWKDLDRPHDLITSSGVAYRSKLRRDGFTMADSDAFDGDVVSHTLSWKGRTDLIALRGRRVMLRIHMYHAQIYTITI